MTTAMLTPTPGAEIAGLTLAELLAERAHCTVWTARLSSMSGSPDLVAKIPQDSSGLADVKHEATVLGRILAALPQQRGLQRLHSVHPVSPGQLMLVTGLIPGATLGSIFGPGRLASPEQAIEIGRALALKLAALHEAGVFHRDVAPGNVIVSSTRSEGIAVTPIDFGVATCPGLSRDTAEMRYGNPSFAPPEFVIRFPGDEPGVACDVFSWAATIYWMLTGLTPYGALLSSWDAAVARLRKGDIRLLDEFAPGPLQALLQDCLSIYVATRPTAAEVADRLAAM